MRVTRPQHAAVNGAGKIPPRLGLPLLTGESGAHIAWDDRGLWLFLRHGNSLRPR
ncbi:hypothetical protein GA0115252_123740 [Streptomyces sp. DfronAA-171]|nr:hypothetical protein GA0115252_123740 [Streptomyces sp. DfronAA-171]